MKIMKKKISILLTLTFVTLTAFAQEDKSLRGYQGIVELGGATVMSSGTKPFLGSADFMNGYRFNANYFMGIGVGIKSVLNAFGEKGSYFVPLYGSFRTNLFSDTSHKVFPYTQTKIGIAFATGGDQLFLLHQSFGIGLKDTPISLGLSGDLFSINGMSIFAIGLNISFSFNNW